MRIGIVRASVLRGLLRLLRIGVDRLIVARYAACACIIADKLRQNHVRPDFYNAIPGNKDVVRGGYAFEKALFAWDYEAYNATAIVEYHVADMSQLTSVRNIDDCFARHFRK